MSEETQPEEAGEAMKGEGPGEEQQPAQRRDPARRRKQVAVFGGGIAGLTAAHELVERGFLVEVYERNEPYAPDRMTNLPCSLGGMARTQWARVERDEPFGDFPDPAAWPQSARPSRLVLDVPETPGSCVPKWKVDFQNNSAVVDAAGLATIRVVANRIIKAQCKVVEVRGYSHDRTHRTVVPGGGTARIDGQRAHAVKEALEAAVGTAIPGFTVEAFGFGLGHPDDWTLADAERCYASFHVRENLVPGEHGFRYFPAYYRNVFDTMRRTPIVDPHGQGFTETARTVLDNLVPTRLLAFATSTAPEPFPYQSHPKLSARVFFDQLRGMLETTGGTLADVQHFQLKLFQFMTSCQKRRATYEDKSWFDFLEAWRTSPEFQQHLDGGGEVLVSMHSRNCDARSYGSASVQVLAAMFDPFGRSDATLNAPTGVAWFEPWRRYLESQGVVFRRGELLRFETMEETGVVWPVVDIWKDEESGPVRTLVDRDYYVVATGAKDLQDIVVASDLDDGDFRAVRDFPLGDPRKARTGGALEHMSGIQYYLATDFRFIEGHIMFPDTDFRLSAIFQPQFWMNKRGWWSGYRGLLSVDISNWHRGGTWAWDLKPDELAQAVLEQMRAGFNEGRVVGHRTSALNPMAAAGYRATAAAKRWAWQAAAGATPGPCEAPATPTAAGIQMPRPLFYHIDQDMEYGAAGVIRNRSPYLMCRPGEYALRPGAGTIGIGVRPAYALQKDCIVIAGTLMQTRMRLTTMESACESGRRAANAILVAEGFGPVEKGKETKGELCEVFDLEQYEPEDLKIFVEIDEALCAAGLPHMVEILDLRELPEQLLEREGGKAAAAADGPELTLPGDDKD